MKLPNFKWLMLLFIALFASVSLAACGDDDDDAIDDGSIYGTWVSTATYNANATNQYTETITINFKSDGTGYRKIEYNYVTGAVSSDMYTFHYVVTTATNGEKTVRVTDDDDNYQQTWTVIRTGNTLQIGSRIYTKA
jgi:hypothetical protein